MVRLRRLRVVPLVLLPALALAACSATYDQGTAQDSIKHLKQKEGFKVQAVHCPDSVTIKVGTTFSCAVSATAPDGTQENGHIVAKWVSSDTFNLITPILPGSGESGGTGTST